MPKHLDRPNSAVFVAWDIICLGACGRLRQEVAAFCRIGNMRTEEGLAGILPTSSATRRWVLIAAVAASGSLLVGLLLPNAIGIRISVFAPSGSVVTFARAAADDGYVIVGVQSDHVVNLVAKDGRVVHAWHVPHALHGMARLDPDGSLLYLGEAPY